MESENDANELIYKTETDSWHRKPTYGRQRVGRYKLGVWDQQVQTTIDRISSVQSRPILCDPMNCSMPGLPVHLQLPEFTQTHAHRVGEAIQPSHPLSSPSPPSPYSF